KSRVLVFASCTPTTSAAIARSAARVAARDTTASVAAASPPRQRLNDATTTWSARSDSRIMAADPMWARAESSESDLDQAASQVRLWLLPPFIAVLFTLHLVIVWIRSEE